MAALISVLYGVLAAAWILYSSRVAASAAGSVQELQRLELLKGLGFIALTFTMFFLGLLYLLRRIQRHQQLLSSQYSALVQADRAMLAGTLASSIAHDMNNALMTCWASLAKLRSTLGDRDTEELSYLEDTLHAVGRLSRRLVEVGHQKIGAEAEPFDLAELLDSGLSLARRHPTVRRCKVELECPESLEMTGAPALVTNAVLNLLLNAAEATAGEGRVLVRVEEGDEAVALCVEDDGPGIPEEHRTAILRPFFSTKDENHGLGLVSLTACAGWHGGEVRIETSTDLGGARLCLTLPRTDGTS